MIATLLALAMHPAAMPPAQWLSPGLRRGDEVLYIASTGGVYVYRRHPALELAGFVFVQDGANLVGPALGPNNDLYVINNGQSFGAGVVEEYHHSVRGFRLVRQFTGVGYGSSLAVGPDGDVYVVASQGELLEYDASGGAPVRTLHPRRYGDVATGVVVDARSDVFVSYQYQPSDDASAVRDLGFRGGSGCRRHRGTIVEFAPHSTKGRCINGTPDVTRPANLTLDSTGNLLVGRTTPRGGGQIAVLSPPGWGVARMIPTSQIPGPLAFGAANHLYFLGGFRVVELAYADGAVVGSWPVDLPSAGGLAVGRW
jgi:hypothetical protein